MRPLRLRVKGVLAFKKPIDLDLSAIPPGLVSIIGPNGVGKTTLLDMMSGGPIYRQLSTRSKSLQTWCTGRDAEIDLTTSFQGREYRLLVQIDTQAAGGAGKQEAWIWEDGVPLTQFGRTTDYDEAIKRIFPSRSLFLASAFGAQNKAGTFFSLDLPERKDLFARLLGLEHMQRLAERAGAGRRPLDAIAAQLDLDVTRLQDDRTAAEEVRREIAQAKEWGARLADETEALQRDHDQARKAHSTANAILEQLEQAVRVATERRRDAQAALDAASSEIAGLDHRLGGFDLRLADAASVEARAAELLNVLQEKRLAGERWKTAKGVVDAAQKRVDDLQADLTRTRASLAQARTRADVGAAGLEVKAMEQQLAGIADVKAELSDCLLRLADAPGVSMRLRNARAELGATDLQLQAIRTELDGARRGAALLEKVPCEGAWAKLWPDVEQYGPAFDDPDVDTGDARDCSTCQFLTSAQAQAQAIPGLEQQLQELEAKRTTQDEVLRTETQAQAAIDRAREDQAQLQRQHSARVELETRLQVARTRIENATVAEAEVTRLEGLIAPLEQEIAAGQAALEKAQTELDAVVTGGHTLASRVEALAGADVALERLQEARAGRPLLLAQREQAMGREAQARTTLAGIEVPPPPTEQEALVAQAASRATATAEALGAADERLQEARARVSRLQGRLEQLGDLDARQAALDARRQRVGLRRAGFVLLEQAMGNQGIQALEIDSSGPEVSGLCNELLESFYGPRFAVALRTIQEAGAGKRQKEVFDLSIRDTREGHLTTHEGLSGGQGVVVDEALRLALSVFNARRHGSMFECLFRDEADGALDERMASVFPSMLRRAMEVGGFRNVYYVTQRPQSWMQADTRIVIGEDGSVSVE